MKHLAIALMVGALAVPAAAAPVPKETPAEKLRRIYGACLDPDKDCRFTLDGEALHVRVGGTPHRLVPTAGPSNAPRTLRAVEGDFVASVRVRQPRALRANVDPAALHAGLLLVPEDGKYVYVARRLQHPDGKTPQHSALYGQWVGGQIAGSTLSTGKQYAAPSLVFRVTRTGDDLHWEVSEDGKSNWTTLAKLKDLLPAKISVGVFASHDGETAIEAVFEAFTVTTPPQR